MKPSFPEKVRATLDRHGMLSPGETVVAAVSGGGDSCALLAVLKELADAMPFRVAVAHLDHQLRGDASMEDGRFVGALAQRWGLPFFPGTEDVARLARSERCSVEAAARAARYRFLMEVASRTGAAAVATGHVREDRVETFLINLFRGTGPDGLASLRAVRPLAAAASPTEKPPRLIRPLIECSHAEAADYLQSLGIEPRADATNYDTRYLRNRIRHELLPLIREAYSPGIDEHVTCLLEVLQAEVDYLSAQVHEVVESECRGATVDDNRLAAGLSRRGLRALPLPLQRRLVRRAYMEVHGDCQDLSFQHVEKLLHWLQPAANRGQWTLPGGVEVTADSQQVSFGLTRTPAGGSAEPAGEVGEFVIPLQVPGLTRIEPLNMVITAEVFDRAETGRIPRDRQVAWIHYGVNVTLSVRPHRPGERFWPLGSAGTQKLQDFFVNARVPRRCRGRIPVVTAGEQIVWVVGYRLDDRFRIRDDTTTVLELRVATENNMQGWR